MKEQNFYIYSDASQLYSVCSFVSESNDLFFLRLRGGQKERALLYSLYYCLRHINPLFKCKIHTLDDLILFELKRLLTSKDKFAYNVNTKNQDIWAAIYEMGIQKFEHIELTKSINQNHTAFEKLRGICSKALMS